MTNREDLLKLTERERAVVICALREYAADKPAGFQSARIASELAGWLELSARLGEHADAALEAQLNGCV